MIRVCIYTEDRPPGFEKYPSKTLVQESLAKYGIEDFSIFYGDGFFKGHAEACLKVEIILPPLFGIAQVLQAAEDLRQANKQWKVLVTVEKGIETHTVKGADI
jgi:hypothetical protein